eukprot:s753_g14.t1
MTVPNPWYMGIDSNMVNIEMIGEVQFAQNPSSILSRLVFDVHGLHHQPVWKFRVHEDLHSVPSCKPVTARKQLGIMCTGCSCYLYIAFLEII